MAKINVKTFPKEFLLGTATSALQVEGAWDEDKAPTMWDDYFHGVGAKKSNKYYLDMPPSLYDQYKAKGVQPRLVDAYKGMPVYEIPASKIIDESYFNYNGDVAADAYHKTDTDVALLKEMGVNVYRFSICPKRILPEIHAHTPGQKGVDYYNRLIDTLLENGIKPMATLYHYDASSEVNVYGGHLHTLSITVFEEYARFCFKTFGDRVKYWTTMADIQVIAEGHGSEHYVPGFQEHKFSGFLDYIALKNMLISSGTVWHLYRNEFQETQKGECSITIEGSWFYPEDPNNPEHQRSAELARLSTFGMIVHALADGEYPAEVTAAVEENSKREGFPADRLKKYTDDEKKIVIGAFDYIVFNYYNSIKVRPFTAEELANELNHKRKDRGYYMTFDNITPAETYEGFLNCLKYIDRALDHPKIFIGENGFPEDEGCDNSLQKIAYHKGILNKLLEALDQNINVFGYCVWSFIDTLELGYGYRKKYGIYAVDFDDESRPRTKKKSFSFFQKLFQTKTLEIEN